MAKLPRSSEVKAINQELGDIAGKLDRISSLSEDWDGKIVKQLESHRDLNREISDLQATQKRFAANNKEMSEDETNRLIKMQKEVAKLGSSWNKVALLVGGKLFQAFDKLGKSIIDIGLGVFELGLQKIWQGINKVYQVHEKWAKLMGEFRNKLGVTTKSLGAMSKVAAQVEGTMHGLTGQFGMGAPMVNEFLESLGRMETTTGGGDKALADMVKTGTLASRVLGISAGDAGELTHSLQQMGDGAKEQKDLFLTISSGAKTAGVSTAKFGKDVVQSHEFMASFGKDGRKVFTTLVTYANKLGVSMKSIEAFTKMTDTFDSTAESVAKMNTVFGTTINSLDLMLEQDPSKRLETVRQALLSQGKTYDQLSRQERGFLAETMHVTEEELAGVLKTGKSLDDVQKEAEKNKKAQEKSQKNMAMLINKTATTLFSFSAAWDKVTGAIEKLISPFTKALGLTADFDKNGKRLNNTFGGTMSKIFDRLIKFINEVASNPEWTKFMQVLANDAKSLAKHISDIATGPGLGKWIHNVVTGATDFYDMMKKAFDWISKTIEKLMPTFEWILKHLKEILITWVAVKGAMGVFKVGKGLYDMVDLLRGAAGGAGSLGSKMMDIGKMPVGMAAKKFSGIGMPGLGLGEGMKGAGYAGATSKMGMLGKGALGAGIGGIAGMAGGALAKAGGMEFKHEGMSDVGSMVGGAVGMIFGPVGAAVGGLIGKFGGELLGRGIDWLQEKMKSPLEKEAEKQKLKTIEMEKELVRVQEDRLKNEQAHNKVMDGISRSQSIRAQKESIQSDAMMELKRQINDQNVKEFKLQPDQEKAIRDQISDMQALGIKNKNFETVLKALNGEGDITTGMMKSLDVSTADYNRVLDALAAAQRRNSDDLKKKADLDASIQKDRLQRQIDQDDKDIAAKEAYQKRAAQSSYDASDVQADIAKASAKGDKTQAAELDNLTKLFQVQGDFNAKQHALDVLAEKKTQNMRQQAIIDLEKAKQEKITHQKTMEGLEKKHEDALFAIKLRDAVMGTKEFMDFQAQQAKAGMTDIGQVYDKFFSEGTRYKGIAELPGLNKEELDLSRGVGKEPHLAEGGVVTRATRAVVGESGAEAVIPLKNFANGALAKGGQQPMRIVAGDIYLDGAKVGRHLVRELISEQGD